MSAPRPITLPFPSFFTEAGLPVQQPGSQLDQNNAVLSGVINDSSSGWVNYAVDTGVVNAYVVTLPSVPSGYSVGFALAVTFAVTNTTAATINANGLGSTPIVTNANKPLIAGQLPAGVTLPLVYDGTSFRVACPLPVWFNISTAVANSTVDCLGAASVGVFLTFTGATNFSLQLQHLAPGVPVHLATVNGSGSAKVFFITATNPDGVAYSTVDMIQAGQANGGGFVSTISTGVTINAGLGMTFTGTPVAGFICFVR